jgi:hypothetical protein
MGSQFSAPQLPLRDAMWTNQGNGLGQVNLGTPSRAWIGALQGMAANAGLTFNILAFQLETGPNQLTNASFNLGSTPAGLAILVLWQPGDATITWSTEFTGAQVGIDQTAGTYAAFLFAALDGQWTQVAPVFTGAVGTS